MNGFGTSDFPFSRCVESIPIFSKRQVINNCNSIELYPPFLPTVHMCHGLTSSSHIYTIPFPKLVVSKVGTYSKRNQFESPSWRLASGFCRCTHCTLTSATLTGLSHHRTSISAPRSLLYCLWQPPRKVYTCSGVPL